MITKLRKKLETIFDHEVDPQELERLFGYPVSQDRYMNRLTTAKALADLYRLFIIRRQPQLAYGFLDKLDTLD